MESMLDAGHYTARAQIIRRPPNSVLPARVDVGRSLFLVARIPRAKNFVSSTTHSSAQFFSPVWADGFGDVNMGLKATGRA